MPSTVVVHEWIAAHGGSENVAEAMADVLDADVYCLWREDPSRFSSRSVQESPLARSQFLSRHKALSLPLMPWVWRHTDLSAYERIVVSTHAFAHQVGSAPGSRHADVFVYVHTPARYLWAADLDRRGRNPLAKAAAAPLRRLDWARVPRQASFASNSAFVQRRVAETWGVDSKVIHPPVDVAGIQAGGPWRDRLTGGDATTLDQLPEQYVLGASRFVSYKRLDTVIAVGTELELPVVLAGSGPEESRLRALAAQATVPVMFVNRPSTPLLYALYEAAALFVFPAIEDFGIMPVEAMATGTPALVNSVGGARESVEAVDGGAVTTFRSGQMAESAAHALSRDRDALRHRAVEFDTAAFEKRLLGWVAS